MTPAQHQELLDLYFEARDRARLAGLTNRANLIADAADKAFTDALAALVTR